MSATVKQLYLELTQIVSPTTKAGVKITSANIGTVEPAKHSKEDMMLFYNEGRIALFNALSQMHRPDDLASQIGGAIVPTTLDFATDGAAVSASKPAGYMRHLSMATTANVPIFIMPETYRNQIVGGTDYHYAQSATNIFVFEAGNKFYHYGSVITNGTSVKFSYFGIPMYTIADVTGGVTLEAINDNFHPIMLELAVARAHNQGSAAINALAMKLLGGKQQ